MQRQKEREEKRRKKKERALEKIKKNKKKKGERFVKKGGHILFHLRFLHINHFYQWCFEPKNHVQLGLFFHQNK